MAEVEGKEQPKVETPIDNKEKPAPVKEEGKVFLSDFEEKEETPADPKEPAKVETPKLNLSRFKEFADEDEEFDSEDKLVDAFKNLKGKTSKLELIAKGNRIIQEDKDIKSWNSLLQLSGEDLVKEGLTYNFMNAGFSEKVANEKAQAKIDKAKENNPDFIEEEEMKLRGSLRTSINQRATELQNQITEAEKSLPQKTKKETETLTTSVKEKIQSTDNFLGLALGGDEDSIKKIRTKTEKLLDNESLTKLLKDPEFLADALFLHANKKGLQKAITDRSASTRASMLDKIDKAPAVKAPQFGATRTAQQANTKGTFNPKKFR